MKIDLEVKASGFHDYAQTTISNPEPLSKTEEIIGAKKVLPNKAISNQLAFYLVGAVVLVFISTYLFVFAVISIIFIPRKSYKKQLDYYEAAWNKSNFAKNSEKIKKKKVMDKALNIVDLLASPRGFPELIQLKLEQAGLPLRPLEFILFHLLFTLILGFIGSLFAKITGIFLMAILGATLPIFILYILISQRRKRFHNQIPDTLTMIAGSMRAGYGLLQAVNVASEETMPPMSVELKRVLSESRLGLPLEEALEMMANRMQEQNFTWTVMAINIQREVGGNLAEVLEILAETIRDRDRVTRHIKILTVEGKLSAVILVVLPIFMALVLTILNASYMSTLFTTFAGLVMIVLGITLMIVGIIWLRKIVVIEV